MKKLLAIFLCLVMLLSVFVSCDAKKEENEEGEGTQVDPVQAEIDSYVKGIIKAMETVPYRETETETKNVSVITTGGSIPPVNTSETFVFHWDGDNVVTLMDNELNADLSITYYDGTLYVPYTNKKFAVPVDAIEEVMNASGFDEDWFNSFKYKNINITRNDDGTTTISGKGADPSAAAAMSGVFGEISEATGGGMNISMDYDSMESTLLIDAQGRLIKQTYFASFSASLKLEHSGMAMSGSIGSESIYEYGDQYKVSAPENADSYVTASDVMDLVQ